MINACVQILFTSCGSFIKGTSEWVLMYFIIHNKRSSEDVLQRCQQFRVGARRPGFSPPIYIPLYTSTRISRVLFVDHSWPPPSHLFSSLFLPVRSGHHGASPGIGSFFLWPAEWLRGIRLWSSAYFFCIGEFSTLVSTSCNVLDSLLISPVLDGWLADLVMEEVMLVPCQQILHPGSSLSTT